MKHLREGTSLRVRDEQGRLKEGAGYVSKLAGKIGKTRQWVYDILSILDEKPEIKEYLKGSQ